MSHFSHLPFVVLDKIIREVVDVDQQNLDKWVSSLALLGVCREWRKAASYLVYRNAILYGNNEHSIGFVEHSEDKHIGDKLVNTNIGLIKSTGNTHLVKTLSIEMNYPQYYRSLVNKTNAVFSFGQFNWSSVKKIIISGCYHNEMGTNEVQPNSMQDIRRYVELLAKFMPHVSKLDIPIYDNTNAVYPIVNPLLALYSQSLNTFVSNQSCSFTEAVNFTQITTLDFDVGSSKFIPKFCYQYLQNLTLRSIPTSFLWRKLTNIEQEDNIVFPKLRSLSLTFVAGLDVVEIKDTTKLHFPSLKYLDITVPTYDLLKDVFDFEKFQWHNVTKLHLNIKGFVGNLFGEFNAPIQHCKSMANRIKNNMPSVTKIRLGLYPSNNKIQFYNDLVNLYADQLTSIVMFHPRKFTAPQFSNKLSHLTLNANSGSLKNLSKIFAESLRQLILFDLDSAFSWDMLLDKSVSKTINFKQLESIRIQFTRRFEDSLANYQQFINNTQEQPTDQIVLFPRLNSLEVINATLNRLQNIMCYGSSQWPCMRDVNICLAKFDIAKLQDQNIDTDYMKATVMFADCFVEKMPYITSIRLLMFSKCNNYYKRFSTIISNGYAHQLKCYFNNIPTAFAADVQFPKLNQLSINPDSTNFLPLPKLDTTAIEKISIEGDLRNFHWVDSTKNNSSDNIQMSRLKIINIHHIATETTSTMEDHIRSNTAIGRQPFVLHLPKVRKIYVQNVSDECNLVNASIKFTHLLDISIIGSYRALQMFNSSSAGIIDSCNINIKLDSNDDMDRFYKTANAFFGSTIVINFAYLTLNMDVSMLNSQKILWTNLHNLKLNQSVKFDTLLDLPPNMPKLTKLELNSILHDDNSKLNLEHVKPISSSITKLLMNNNVIASTEEMKIDCIKYLLLALPNLKKILHRNNDFNNSVFVEEYKEAYPHLVDITFV